MNAVVLFSGGKDSTLALYKAMDSGVRVKYLVSMFSQNPESYMFHYPNIRLVKLQAESLGIPLLTGTTKGRKEEELKDLKRLIGSVRNEVDMVIAGALASQYQKERIERICKDLGLKLSAPLWGKDPKTLWNEILKLGFKVMITSVSCEGLNRSWLGKVIDRKSLDRLEALSKKYSFHLGGEGGEFETLVVDGPIFKKNIYISDSGVVWKGDSGSFVVKRAKLLPKH